MKRMISTTLYFFMALLSVAIIWSVSGTTLIAQERGMAKQFMCTPGCKGLTGQAYAQEKRHPQQYCPVMGGKIDKSQHVDYHGKRIYFCCPMCKSKFMNDPEKYIKQMESKGIELEKAPQSE